MTDQLKPAAWLINDAYHCTGIEKVCEDNDRSEVIEHWIKEGKATPLYAIQEGYALVPVEPTRNMIDEGFMELAWRDRVAKIYKLMIKAAQGGVI